MEACTASGAVFFFTSFLCVCNCNDFMATTSSFPLQGWHWVRIFLVFPNQKFVLKELFSLLLDFFFLFFFLHGLILSSLHTRHLSAQMVWSICSWGTPAEELLPPLYAYQGLCEPLHAFPVLHSLLLSSCSMACFFSALRIYHINLSVS